MTRKTLVYGALALTGVVVLAGAAYLLAGPARVGNIAATEEVHTTTPPRSNARVATAQPPADPATYSQNQIDQSTRFAGEARRLALAGKFSEAESALDEAEKAAPGLPETAQARRDIAEMRTPQGQLALLLVKARSALERGDHDTADRALDDAERLDATAPLVAGLRRDLDAAQNKDTRKSERLASLLAAMRGAMAKNDFAEANRALNAAERLDIEDPNVRQARVDLNRAQRRP